MQCHTMPYYTILYFAFFLGHGDPDGRVQRPAGTVARHHLWRRPWPTS